MPNPFHAAVGQDPRFAGMLGMSPGGYRMLPAFDAMGAFGQALLSQPMGQPGAFLPAIAAGSQAGQHGFAAQRQFEAQAREQMAEEAARSQEVERRRQLLELLPPEKQPLGQLLITSGNFEQWVQQQLEEPDPRILQGPFGVARVPVRSGDPETLIQPPPQAQPDPRILSTGGGIYRVPVRSGDPETLIQPPIAPAPTMTPNQLATQQRLLEDQIYDQLKDVAMAEAPAGGSLFGGRRTPQVSADRLRELREEARVMAEQRIRPSAPAPASPVPGDGPGTLQEIGDALAAVVEGPQAQEIMSVAQAEVQAGRSPADVWKDIVEALARHRGGL